LKRKRLPRLAALAIALLLVIQSIPALALENNPAGEAGASAEQAASTASGEYNNSYQDSLSGTPAGVLVRSLLSAENDADSETVTDSIDADLSYATTFGQLYYAQPLNSEDGNYKIVPLLITNGRFVYYPDNTERNNGIWFNFLPNVSDQYLQSLVKTWCDGHNVDSSSLQITSQKCHIGINLQASDESGIEFLNAFSKPSESHYGEIYTITRSDDNKNFQFDVEMEYTPGQASALDSYRILHGSLPNTFHFKGYLQAVPYMNFTISFQCNGTQYEVTFNDEADAYQTGFVSNDKYLEIAEADSDADLLAQVKSSDSTVYQGTEHDHVVEVDPGQRTEIAYEFHTDFSPLIEVLKSMYNSIDKNFDTENRDLVTYINNNTPVPWKSYSGTWSGYLQQNNSFLTLTLKLPDGFKYDLQQSGSGIDFKSYSTDNVVTDDGIVVGLSDYCRLYLEDALFQYDQQTNTISIKVMLMHSAKSLSDDLLTHPDNTKTAQLGYIKRLWQDLENSDISIVVPGIYADENTLEAGTNYTAVAKASGLESMGNEAYTMLIGVAQVAAASNNVEREAQSEADSSSSWNFAALYLAASAADDGYDPLYDTIQPSKVDPLNFDGGYFYDADKNNPQIFGHTWESKQDPSTKDYIQTEDNSNEMWFTVTPATFKIHKSVEDQYADLLDKDATYDFEVTMTDKDGNPLNGDYKAYITADSDPSVNTAKTVTFTDGKATVSLKAGETICIGVSDGCKYTVKEDLSSSDLYARYTDQSGTTTTGTSTSNEGVSGVYDISDSIEAGTANVDCCNYPAYSLQVTKKVQSSDDLASLKDKEFPFVIQFKNDNFDVDGSYKAEKYTGGKLNETTGEFEYSSEPTEETVEIKDQKLQTSLKHGESLKITGLPVGTTFTVTESGAEGFSVSGDVDGTSFTGTKASGTLAKDDSAVMFVNTQNPPVVPDTQSVKVKKVWANDDSSTRPSSVKVQLYQNGKVYGNPVTLNESNDWSHTWTGLDADQKYTVDEVNVPDGYESSVTNKDNVWTVTNTKKDTNTPDTQSVKVNKVWANDDSSTRPSSVKMQLYQNGSVYGDAVTLSETNDWSYTWTGLEADQKYTVAEVNVPDGYESSVTNKDNVWTVTNTKKDTTTTNSQSVKVNKVWANDDSSTRPSSVQMQLYQNGSVYGDAVTLSETNDWSYTWTGLEADQEYTVAEVNVPDGYESSVTSTDNVWTVTNTKKGTDTPSNATTNTPGNPSNTTSNTTSNNNSEQAQAENATPAKTGDTTPIGIWLLIILAASAGAIFAVWKKRADR
jgi:hypothetical protein